MELKFATNQELLNELSERTTFMGLMVYLKDDLKNQYEIKFDDFNIQARNLLPEQAVELLRSTVESLEYSIKEGEINYEGNRCKGKELDE